MVFIYAHKFVAWELLLSLSLSTQTDNLLHYFQRGNLLKIKLGSPDRNQLISLNKKSF